MGGLGDQINQFVFGKYLAQKFNLNVLYDLTYYSNNPQFSFKLNKFKIAENFEKRKFFPLPYKFLSLLRFLGKSKFLLRMLSKNKINSFYYEKWKINEKLDYKKVKHKTFFFGYWHNKEYFLKNNKILEKILRIKNKSKKMKQVAYQIKKNDVALHIRGKDFLNNIHAIQISEEYYRNAIKKFLNINLNRNFYIFTDDINYSKKIISKFKNIKPIYIKNYKLTDVEEFELLQEFKFLILSNSTFSWTSALLNNKKKKIIIPNHWYHGIKNIQKKKTKEMIVLKTK